MNSQFESDLRLARNYLQTISDELARLASHQIRVPDKQNERRLKAIRQELYIIVNDIKLI